MHLAHGKQDQGCRAGQNSIYQRASQRDQCFFAQVAGAFGLDCGIAHGQPADGQQHKAFYWKSLAP